MEECLVCFDETNQFQLFACGHKVCVYCYPRLRSNKCPVCNQPIEIIVADNIVSKRGCCFVLSIIVGVIVYSYYW